MKRLVSALLLGFFLLHSTSLLAQARSRIEFTKSEHNFGTIRERDGVQTASFEFTNRGSVPLILHNVITSCGCTAPEWSRQPIPPGGKGTIQLAFDPANRPGAFSKTASVQSNADNPMVILTISGRVAERERSIAEQYPRQIGLLRAARNHLSFPTINQNQSRTETLELVNDGNTPVRVSFRQVPEHIQASIAPQTIPAGGKAILTVIYNAAAAKTYGFVNHRIYLNLNGISDYNNSIGVSATIVEDFSTLSAEEQANAPVARFSSMSYDFGNMKQGEKKEASFQLTNSGKRNLMIRTIRASCGCTAITPSKEVIAPGETISIRVVFDSTGKQGRQSKTVTIITNDPRNSTATLRLSSNIG